MTRRRFVFPIVLISALAASARAQQVPQARVVAVKPLTAAEVLKGAEEFVKPLPLEPIPDDPPPHEGALFSISYRIETPDIVLVEVLEALPGRPISGERLVRPDGTVDLGFYGEVRVQGLTATQAKVKIVMHLRRFLTDSTLGLVRFEVVGTPPNNAQRPLDPLPPDGPPEWVPDLLEPPGREILSLKVVPDRADAAATTGYTLRLMLPARSAPQAQAAAPPAVPPLPRDPVAELKGAQPAAVADPVMNNGRFVYVRPQDSLAIFVDVAAYNSKVYYVQGDVGSPGRLAWTGNETVFDAIQFSGGFLDIADKGNVRLFRPARGGKPAKEYRIDYKAIERGDAKANLQIFPGDRLVVERKAHLPPRL